MSMPVTFFRRRDKDEGETYVFKVGVPKWLMGVYVYSRGPVESVSLHDQECSSWEKYEEVIRDLRRIVASQGGGGVIVAIAHEGADRKFRVTPAPREKGGEVEITGLLRAGYPLMLTPVSKEWQELTPSSHLLVPVDRTEQEHLRAFQEQLGFLPADLESLIVNSIRRPSLDTRLTRLERKVSAQEAAEGEAAGGRFRRLAVRVAGWLSAPALGWLVGALVLGALLYYNAQLLETLSAQVESQSRWIEDLAARPRGRQVQRPSPQPAPQPTFVNDLLRDLAAKKNANESLRQLYQAHFAPYGDTLFDQRIQGLFERKPDNRLFLLGLVKLEAMKLAAGRQDAPLPPKFFSEPNNPTAVKEWFRKIGTDTLMADPAAGDLLAFLACRLNNEATPSPRLPGTNGSPFSFAEGGRCAEFGIAQAESGMKDLSSYLRGL